MALFGRRQKDLHQGGLTGTAAVRNRASADFWDEHSRYPEDGIRLTDYGLGQYTYRLALDVTLDDPRPVYPVEDKFKIPAGPSTASTSA